MKYISKPIINCLILNFSSTSSTLATAALIRSAIDEPNPEQNDIEVEDDNNSTTDTPVLEKRVKPTQRFRWSEDKTESLLKCLGSLKAEYEVRGLDFEADLVKLYSDVRERMAEIYNRNDFGPVEQTVIDDDLSPEDIAKTQVIIAEEKKMIKVGYTRIREKIKNIRQDFRNASLQGRRSGSGQFNYPNKELLEKLWGGSPATSCIANARTSLEEAENNQEFQESFELQTEQPSLNENNSFEDDMSDSTPQAKGPTAKFVDNKRKMLEKNLSANQRDQVFLNLARDEVKLKEKLIDGLTEATIQSNRALENISQSIVAVGKSIGDGLALLANALSAGQNQNQFPQSCSEYPMGSHNHNFRPIPNSYSRNYLYEQQRMSYVSPPQDDVSRTESPQNFQNPSLN